MIYIDPPYNTGNDFIYKDDYHDNLQNYLEKTNQNSTTNKETSGRYHTEWLNMMYPRLLLARNLLKEDGVIFISIDDNEVNNLKKVCDEIFGEYNYLGNILWNSTKSVTNTALISVSHTYNLVYFKDKNYFINHRSEFRIPDDGEGFSNPDNDPRGPWKADPFQVGGWRPNQQYEIINPNTGVSYKPNKNCSWKNDYNKFQELLKDNRIVFGKTGESGPQRKRFKTEAMKRGKVVKTWWDDIETTTNGTQLLKKIFNNHSLFNNPKPVSLLYKMILLGTNDNNIVLDFFSGSATTAHAVMQLNAEDNKNNKFIMVQLPEPCDEKSEAYKNGYKNICEIGKERIRRAGDKILEENPETDIDMGFQVFKLDSSNITKWDESIDNLNNLTEYLDIVKEDRTDLDLLYEIMLKYGIELTYPIMQTESLYIIGHGTLICCFKNNINEDIIKEIKNVLEEYQPIDPRILFKDNSFDSDQTKANIKEELKQLKINEFITI